jgi:exodeoxyribonuclease-5
MIDADLVIVDEASMLDASMIEDLESFGVPVLYVGDHGQLEPVGDDPGLMREPQIRLETIHRQAAGSPIVQFAHLLRRGVSPASWSGDEAVRVPGFSAANVLDYDVILCAPTRPRRRQRGCANEGLRRCARGRRRLICLQNNKDMGLFNGMLATVSNVRSQTADAFVLDLEDGSGPDSCRCHAAGAVSCVDRPSLHPASPTSTTATP